MIAANTATTNMGQYIASASYSTTGTSYTLITHQNKKKRESNIKKCIDILGMEL